MPTLINEFEHELCLPTPSKPMQYEDPLLLNEERRIRFIETSSHLVENVSSSSERMSKPR